jgi:hypothetical protein
VSRAVPAPYRFALALAVTAAVCLGGANASAQNGRIANLTASVANNAEMRVSGDLLQWLTPELRRDIDDGIPKDLYFYILLKKRQPGWFDEDVAAKTIRHTIKYDTLKKQYLITSRDGDSALQRVEAQFEDAADLISRLRNVTLTTEKRLRLRHTYYISVKAEMRATKVPFYLEYILFFIPVLELDTPWADSAPIYAIETRNDMSEQTEP